jgi:hypothetical protein
MCTLPAPVEATPLNRWQVSCGADAGSIRKEGKARIFRTSTNHCPGGIFTQRAEIYTDRVAPTTKGAYLFTAHLAMTSPVAEKYDIFQMHDGRRGCAPPLKLTVLKSGRMELTSDLKTGPGESCQRGWLDRGPTPARFRRDGTEQKLEVLVNFDGRGGFAATVWLDGPVQLQGAYKVPEDPKFFRSDFFYFKHGVYSERMFRYEMRSRDMQVRKVRLKGS